LDGVGCLTLFDVVPLEHTGPLVLALRGARWLAQ